MKIRIILAVSGLIGLNTVSYAQDVDNGAKIFKKCMACHAIDDKNKIGPSLKGIVGRKAATVEGFKYSDAMLAKGAEGVVWDEATLDRLSARSKGLGARHQDGLSRPKEARGGNRPHRLSQDQVHVASESNEERFRQRSPCEAHGEPR